MAEEFEAGCCYLLLILPDFRERARMSCSVWPTLGQILSLASAWFDYSAFLRGFEVVEQGYYHVVPGVEKERIFENLLVLSAHRDNWPMSSLGSHFANSLYGIQTIEATMSLTDRLGGEVAPKASLMPMPPLSPLDMVGKPGVTEPVITAYYAAYVRYLDAQSAAIASESSEASSVALSTDSSSVDPSSSQVSVNSSASSGRAARRARRRRKLAAMRAARKAEGSASGITVVSSVPSVSSSVSRQTFASSGKLGQSCGSGRCYASLFSDVDGATAILGNSPTFREILRLSQRMLSIEKIRSLSVERTGPGIYHLGGRGPSIVDTLAMLVEQDEEFADSVFRGLRYPLILRDKVMLDDRLGLDVRGLCRGLYLRMARYAMGPVTPPGAMLVLPEVTRSHRGDCIQDESARVLEDKVHIVTDWYEDHSTGLTYRSYTTAFGGMPASWLTLTIHNDWPHEPMAVAIRFPKKVLVRVSADQPQQSVEANRCLWVMVTGLNVVFDFYWSLDFGLSGINFHAIRKFSVSDEPFNSLPVSRIVDVDFGRRE